MGLVMDGTNDTRLGELLGRYQHLKATNPATRVEALEAEAGALYPELVELVACLDLVTSEGPDSAPADEPRRPPPPAYKSRWLVLLLAVACAALLVWTHLRRRAPVALRIDTNPEATLTLDGMALPDSLPPGQYRLRAVREGFHPLEWTVEVAGGGPYTEVVFLEPLDPFNFDSVNVIARSAGITHLRLPGVPPPPRLIKGARRGMEVLAAEPREASAEELELRRLPRAIRATPSAQLIVAERLYRLRHYRSAYELASALANAHPDRKPPLLLALHALWALELVDSELYGELHARYLEAE